MIATLTGTVAEKLLDVVVLDVHGVGYALFVTHEDYGKLSQNDRAQVYVYEHIREAMYDLFGFTSKDTKRLFEQLLTVNGVGPKMALNVLNSGNAMQVRQAIAGGDTKYIQQAQGVGKRVAERIVIELKDKVGLVGIDLGTTDLLQPYQQAGQDEAAEALIALGFTLQDAQRALASVNATLPTEERVKQALRSHR